MAQKKSITGIITDTAGEAVIGASIVEVGTTNGTVSDVEGNFTLSVSDNASIQVSFIGFSSQTLSVQGKMNFKIILKEDSELLQEVVVTGYGGKVSRAKLTNSISTVSPQILEKGIYTNPSQALSGSVPGLKVSLTSGNPTSSPKVILRGGTEFDGSGGPLVIVDGQLRDNFDDINPQDIASMDVLKDAGATAIYGARASNGVILITTKSGRAGHREINFRANIGLIPTTFWARKTILQSFVQPIKIPRGQLRQILQVLRLLVRVISSVRIWCGILWGKRMKMPIFWIWAGEKCWILWTLLKQSFIKGQNQRNIIFVIR